MDGYYYDDGYPPGGYDYPGEYEGCYPEDYHRRPKTLSRPLPKTIVLITQSPEKNDPSLFEGLYDDGTQPGNRR